MSPLPDGHLMENGMHEMMTRLSPGATTMIRMDHTHAMATFHQYRIDASPGKKHAIAETLCHALEIHARLEEEIFYPAMRSVDPDLVNKSVPEHNEMRRMIAQLRQTRAEDPAFDTMIMQLMRDVIRHVADQETQLLPDAERVLAHVIGLAAALLAGWGAFFAMFFAIFSERMAKGVGWLVLAAFAGSIIDALLRVAWSTQEWLATRASRSAPG